MRSAAKAEIDEKRLIDPHLIALRYTADPATELSARHSQQKVDLDERRLVQIIVGVGVYTRPDALVAVERSGE